MKPEADSFALGVDIGGSKAAFALINSKGDLLQGLDTHPVPFTQSGPADPRGLIEIMEPYVRQARAIPGIFQGIGLSVCGNIDTETGEAVLVPNLHWHNLPFGQMVVDKFSLPVYAATDVRMAALAEAIWGAARGVRNFAWVTIGTGFGGYLFLDGKLYGGSHGFAGNFGHNTIDEINGFLCGCGHKGCLETFVAGPAIARAGQAAADQGRSPRLLQMRGQENVVCPMVFQAEAFLGHFLKQQPGAE